MNMHGSLLSAALPFFVIAIVLALRFRSMSRERPLKLGSLWIVPLVYALLAGSMLVTLTPPLIGWGLLIVGLAIGIGIGWHRGKLIHISRNPETGELSQRASPLALFLLLALVVLKLGARAIFGNTAAGAPGSNAMLMTDAFIGFALGLLAATRLEIYLRGRKLLEDQ